MESILGPHKHLKIRALVSWFTKACWTRAFELLGAVQYEANRPERQMKALLPTYDKAGNTFMAMFFLSLPSELKDHHRLNMEY